MGVLVADLKVLRSVNPLAGGEAGRQPRVHAGDAHHDDHRGGVVVAPAPLAHEEEVIHVVHALGQRRGLQIVLVGGAQVVLDGDRDLHRPPPGIRHDLLRQAPHAV